MPDLHPRALNGRFSNFAVSETHFGPGCLRELSGVLQRDGVQRPMLVTGRTLARNVSLIDRIARAIGSARLVVYTNVASQATREAALGAAQFAKSSGADALLSLGGSSQNDTAKAAAWAMAEDITHCDEFDRYAIRVTGAGERVVPRISGRALPIYAIPTTLSAGEFTNIAGVTDAVRRHKYLYQDRQIAARAVFLDPQLTMDTPESLWLSSGIKAIDHCVEAWLSTRAQPVTDALAAAALGKLFEYLPLCRREPGDLAARVECQVAAWMSVAGLANLSLGLSHGIGHQLGAVSHVPHGLTSCVILHHVIGFNREAAPGRHALLSELVGLSAVEGDRATSLEDATLRLVRDQLGLPWRLRDVGVERADFGRIARGTLQDPLIAGNPRRVTSEQELVGLLDRAW